MYDCKRRNLGDRGRDLVLRVGVISSGVALLSALLVFELEASRSLGWLLALPVAFAAYGLISGSLGICGYHALRGLRRPDHGAEAVLDHETRARMRSRALLAVSTSLCIGLAFATAFVASV